MQLVAVTLVYPWLFLRCVKETFTTLITFCTASLSSAYNSGAAETRQQDECAFMILFCLLKS